MVTGLTGRCIISTYYTPPSLFAVSMGKDCLVEGKYQYARDLQLLVSYRPRSHMRVPERLQVVCTPLRVDCWARYLRTHPDQEFVGFLLSGMREGFRIGCDCHVVCCRGAERNKQSTEENPMMMDN